MIDTFVLNSEYIAHFFSSWIMIGCWTGVMVYALLQFHRKTQLFFLLMALICLPPCLYYGWALSGIISGHYPALIFNRLADLMQLIGIALIVRGMSVRN